MFSNISKVVIYTLACTIPLSVMAKTVSIRNYEFDINQDQPGDVQKNTRPEGECGTYNPIQKELKSGESWYSSNVQNEDSSYYCTKKYITDLRRFCYKCYYNCPKNNAVTCDAINGGDSSAFTGENLVCSDKRNKSNIINYYKSCKCADGWVSSRDSNYSISSSFNAPTSAMTTFKGKSLTCYKLSDITCAANWSNASLKATIRRDSDGKFPKAPSCQEVRGPVLSANANENIPNTADMWCVYDTVCHAPCFTGAPGTCAQYTYTPTFGTGGYCTYHTGCSGSGNCGTPSNSSLFQTTSSNITTYDPSTGSSSVKSCNRVTGCKTGNHPITQNGMAFPMLYGSSFRGKNDQNEPLAELSVDNLSNYGVYVADGPVTKGDYTCYALACSYQGKMMYGHDSYTTALNQVKAEYSKWGLVKINDAWNSWIICADTAVPQTCPVSQCDASCDKSASWIRYFLPQ